MSQFSTIMQDPAIRDIVQSRTLQREFKDALREGTLFRSIAEPVKFEGNLGDSKTFTREGEITPDYTPIEPGLDAGVAETTFEQWDVRPQQRGKSRDVHMPTSARALADRYMRAARSLGVHAGRSLSRMTRWKSYAAALSGRTMTNTAGAGINNLTLIPVKNLNGLTRARLSNGTTARYNVVSSLNPLSVNIRHNPGGGEAYTTRNIVGFTPAVAGMEDGLGSILLDVAVTFADDHEIVAADATQIVRRHAGADAGLGLLFATSITGIDDIANGDLFTMADIRAAVRRLRSTHVPTWPDGLYRGFLDSTSEAQLFADDDVLNLLKEVPGHVEYREMAIGVLQGVVFMRAEECPQTGNVTASDRLPLEIANGNGVKIHRPIVFGFRAIEDHYVDMSEMITDVGLLGKEKDFNLSTDGIELNTERIQFLTRKPLDRLQQISACTWSAQNDVVVGTDGVDADSGGDVARYKRFIMIEHGDG